MFEFDWNLLDKYVVPYEFIVVAVAGFILYHYNKEYQNYIDTRRKYYELVLLPFHIKCISNRNVSVSKFANKYCLDTHPFVPSYVVYLLLECKKNKALYDKLKKVLIVDYEGAYDSRSHSFYYGVGRILDYVAFLIVLFTVLGLTAILYFSAFNTLTSTILILAKNGIFNQIQEFGLYDYIHLVGPSFSMVVLFVIICLTTPHFMGRFVDWFLIARNDEYTTNKKLISKLIDKKIKRYDKFSSKIYYCR